LKLQLDTGGSHAILSYTATAIRLPTLSLERSFILCPDRLIADWAPQTLAELSPGHFDPVIALDPEIVLLGTGARLCFPAASILAPLRIRQIGVEVMDTPAACRSYNVLSGEGRRVVAAFFMIHLNP